MVQRCAVAGIVMFALAACAAGHPAGELRYTAGAAVETLSSPVSLSFSSPKGGMSGSGYLAYRRPDRMRLVILSPFGTTFSEIVLSGSRITIVNFAAGRAWAGDIRELPDLPEYRHWRLARWVMETGPPGEAKDGTVERVTTLGVTERATYVNGLLVARALPDGSEARYGRFVVVKGVPVATEIVMTSPDGSRFRMLLTEPEVNEALPDDTFTPRVDGMPLLPLTLLQER